MLRSIYLRLGLKLWLSHGLRSERSDGLHQVGQHRSLPDADVRLQVHAGSQFEAGRKITQFVALNLHARFEHRLMRGISLIASLLMTQMIPPTAHIFERARSSA